MLFLTGATTRTGYRVSRREILRLGGLSALGLLLPQLLQGRSPQHSATQALPGFGRARSCIVLFLMGAPPQHSTWDPKPGAPAEIRGEIAPIETNVPGITVGELMPRTAQFMDRIAVLRAMSTDDNAHSSSGYFMMTA